MSNTATTQATSESPTAMILAAGRGSRLRPLTDHIPKPLAQVGPDATDTLIAARLRALAEAGVRDVVINTAWLGEQIQQAIGDGGDWGLAVQYSHEGGTGLETGGGLLRALPMLGDRPVIVSNADIWTDQPLAPLVQRARAWQRGMLAHLVLVDAPAWHPIGEFDLDGDAVVRGTRYTLAGLHVLHPQLLDAAPAGIATFSIVPLLMDAIDAGKVTGQRLHGHWDDIGTLERLEALRHRLREAQA